MDFCSLWMKTSGITWTFWSLSVAPSWGFFPILQSNIPRHHHNINQGQHVGIGLLSEHGDAFQSTPYVSLAKKKEENSVELWLDLRDTALFPQAALTYLSENIDGMDHQFQMVDRVIMSEETMQQVILREEKEKEAPVTHDDIAISKIIKYLYVPNRSDDLVFSCRQLQQSLPCGKVVESQEGTLFSPLQALDIIMTNGGWVLLERYPDMPDTVWMQEVSSLLAFLLASSSSTLDHSLALNGMSFLDTISPNESQQSNTNNIQNPVQQYASPAGNGFAIACPSPSLLMEISKAILSQTSFPSSTYTSPGGIVIADKSGAASDRGDKDRLTVALVLPLDIKLWQTAIDLFFDIIDDSSQESECG